MRAGELRHKIYIRPPLKTITGKRDMQFTYDPVDITLEADAFASIEPIRGRELIVARGIRADVTHKIKTRYNTSIPITQMCQISWYDGNRIRQFEIGPEVDPELRNIEQSFYAMEIR